MNTDRNRLRGHLPNVPTQAFDAWLNPHVDHAGWPDCLSTLEEIPSPWNRYLLGQPLGFWQATKWQYVEKSLGALVLDAAAKRKIHELVDAWDYFTLTNAWSPTLIANSRLRIERVLDFIRVDSAIPGDLVLLNRNDTWYILDGYHRLAAACIASPPPRNLLRFWVAE